MNNNGNSGESLFALLFVLFLGLKLAKIVTWSWWWIFAPLWIPFSIVFLIVVLIEIGKAIEREKRK